MRLDTRQFLASVRVLDIGDAKSDGVGRLLADLGADVLKVEPPGGDRHREARPTVQGASVAFAVDNANKRSTVLDPADARDRDRLTELVGEADILIDGRRPGGLAAFGTSAAEMANRFDHLVAVEVTDFGTTGPRAGWQATDAVLYAMSTALSRSGPTTGRPVLPPVGIASATAAAQAAWVALVAYHHRLRCGRGDYVDFSRFEAVVTCLDPPFGSEGQAAVGQKRAGDLWRGRPRNQQIYPTFSCRDGFVRICLLSARQWRGMRAWLGEPDQFADPRFETIAARYLASDEINALIATMFATETMDVLVADGQRRGVPIAALLTPAEALASEHFQSVGALVGTRVGGAEVTVPTGAFVVDGRHVGVERSCPAIGVDDARWSGPRIPLERNTTDTVDRPFEGMRVLDLGVIVAGGELGRLFADLGAEVIKVESAAYPDGLRQTPPGRPMSRSWALTHRNESSIGLDLRHPEGAALFRRLVANSDAVFANFKPGTLASLGFSYEELRRENPRIVLAESSAFGDLGPWSDRMGYGPLVRATTGISRLWTSGSNTDQAFYDATTIFPDHVVARITAIAALAALLDREASGSGARVHVSQAEAAINQLATSYAAEAARAAGVDVSGDDAVYAVIACAGDDEWCVVSVRDDEDRAALATVIGIDHLPADPVDALATWAATRDKADVVETLQEAGVAAGPMNRASDVAADPQLESRGFFATMDHPLFEAPMLTEAHPAPFRHIPDAPLRPAPMAGEHTRRIATGLLGLDDAEIERLIDDGVLFARSDTAPEKTGSTP